MSVGTGFLGFLLFATFLAYVGLIAVPLVRHKPGTVGDGGVFDWHFLVPCLNEEAVVERTVRQLLASFPQAIVWCIDDASSDATAAIVRRLETELAGVRGVYRRFPDAQKGKGAALNAGWAMLRQSVDLQLAEHTIVGVVDADGRLDPHCADVLAGLTHFGSAGVGAVQVRVRVEAPPTELSRFQRVIVELQDLEFSGPIAAMQLLRRHLGSVGMGGNGQFTRLSVLERLGEKQGQPWQRALLEDFELGLHVLMAGARTSYCHDTWVAQQGLCSLRLLVRQRSRWAQGLMQCFKYFVPVLRSRDIKLPAAMEIAYFLFLPWLQLLGSLLYAGSVITLTWLAWTQGGASFLAWLDAAGLLLLLGIVPFVVWGPLYRFADGVDISRRRALLLGIANWPYSWVHQAATWWAVVRFARSRNDWKKTVRNPVEVARIDLRNEAVTFPTKRRVMLILGTRPEAIKLAPIALALKASADFDPFVVVTGQHREMLDQVLQTFAIKPDLDLDLIRDGQTPADILTQALPALSSAISELRPESVLVQGDIASTFVGALAAFYSAVPTVHVEAGLRTGDARSPFPEETHRRVTTLLASLHLAPTASAKANLLREGIAPSDIVVTGNSVIDALQWTSRQHEAISDLSHYGAAGQRILLVTAHRRESWGAPMRAISRALAEIARIEPNVHIVFPVHRNPTVRDAVMPALQGLANVAVIEPLDYEMFVQLMQRSYLILTDSGGIQEEGPSLGKPVLLMRDTTERPEALNAGTVRLVGTDEERIIRGVRELLHDDVAYEAMAHAVNPYGDGHAAERTVEALRYFLAGGRRPPDFTGAAALAR